MRSVTGFTVGNIWSIRGKLAELWELRRAKGRIERGREREKERERESERERERLRCCQ
jgi:hypothetical protein